ncbi:chemotaxis protein [Helicobacter valdiviensis]|uniref:protein-glutamate O-methyltransferase n=1 Tax=Helicobacter valdiviensis TaxID=1458358 RepID=A0A2W6MW58_9HELI|nr:protein-glutamate O-methyltransferase CheR [Helicobacter valdiviensis]PZT48744.1 chemotaxis protein [Helicobacter valdiviensis]
MAEITDKDIDKARDIIYELAGTFLPPSKNSTIKNRLDKLARDFNIEDFEAFFRNVKLGRNKQDFINAFTTNKTDFFREGFHFIDMLNRILPHRLKEREPIKVYCAASSTGEEPYSIAATLLHAKEVYQSNTSFSICATDIDTSVLETARKGEYIVNTKLNPLPNWLDLSLYFDMQTLTPKEISLKVKRELKEAITFKQLNLMQLSYPFSQKEFDIIFCRNVLIYFKIEDQEKILQRLFSCLKVGGTLYLGHSESILNLADKVDRLGQNIFIKKVD